MKRLLPLCALLAGSTLALTGCGSSSSPAATTTSASAAASTTSATSAASTTTAAAGSGSASTGGTYTLAQIAQHASTTSCWAAVSGGVYDLTTWIAKHPGGPDKIQSICGKDGTSAFMGEHAKDAEPKEKLATFKIGTLAS